MKSEDAIFKIIVLGCTGGPKEGNMSSYLVGVNNSEDFIALDAGSLLEGLERAFSFHHFDDLDLDDDRLLPFNVFFLKHIKAYLISHPHLDHIAGLIINSQVDQPKPLLGTSFTIDSLRDHIFNGTIWPNYGNEGKEPILNIYQYFRLEVGRKTAVSGTEFFVEAFPLSHPKDYLSTAFLIEYHENYLLYFGDTSADSMEEDKKLTKIWERVAPLIKEKRLKAIFLECSYSMQHADQAVFGHLNPQLVKEELSHLKTLVGGSLEGLNVIVTHRKDILEKGGSMREHIFQQLTQDRSLGINFIFPSQGDKILL